MFITQERPTKEFYPINIKLTSKAEVEKLMRLISEGMYIIIEKEFIHLKSLELEKLINFKLHMYDILNDLTKGA